MAKISLTVDGTAVTDEVEPRMLLVQYLREKLGKTGTVIGCWLVRQGLDPKDALARIAETRGLGCPQTLEQRLLVLGWEAGR